jgi:integrase
MARDRLYTMFSEALQDGLISDNPVRHVKRLEEPTPDIDPFTFEEVEAILREAQGQERAILTILLLTGMRSGEALALRWDDLDFGRGQIRVRNTLSRYGLGAPKTPGSIREVEMLASSQRASRAKRADDAAKDWVCFCKRKWWAARRDQPARACLA